MLFSAFVSNSLPPRDRKLRELLPVDLFFGASFMKMIEELRVSPIEFYISVLTPYQRILRICDFVGGMTDSYAVELYQRLSGIKLPA